MESKINEVQDYFKNKILAGDFETIEIGEYVFQIKVDEKYQFSIWIGNWNIPDNTKLYDSYYNFIMFDLTKEEAIQLKAAIMPKVKAYRTGKLIEEKRKELAKLENELSQ